MYLQPQYRVLLVSVCFCQQCHAIPTVHNQFITRVYHAEMFTSLFFTSPSQVSSLWSRVQVKSQVFVGLDLVKSQVFGHKSKSSLKSLKNKSLMSLLVLMSLLSSAAIRSTKNTAQLYLRNSKHLLYYYPSFIY